jgi:hypothetical protein
MRMGFIVGGILGAVAAMYITRNKPMMLAGFGNALSGLRLSEDTMNKVSKTASSAVKDLSSNKESSVKADLSEVTSILNKDPALKAQVNDILASNGEPISSASYKH